MNSYNKNYLDDLSQQSGFIRDNLEKVMRLASILRYIHESRELGSKLALKGGTAINLTVFQMPRLSVDIDLDYTLNLSREEMLAERTKINSLLLQYMAAEGYTLSPSSKSPHTLDSWVFGYQNSGGNKDSIKIEINYSDRCHVLPIVERLISVDFLGEIVVTALAPVELFASKINALISRAAVRDIYDVQGMLHAGLFATNEERDLLRKILLFYMAVGASSRADDIKTEFSSFPNIESISFAQVRAQLLPVLRKGTFYDFEQAKTEVITYLHDLLHFSESEMAFISSFKQREYRPELLFDDAEIVNRISQHPMALWKCRQKV